MNLRSKGGLFYLYFHSNWVKKRNGWIRIKDKGKQQTTVATQKRNEIKANRLVEEAQTVALLKPAFLESSFLTQGKVPGYGRFVWAIRHLPGC